MKNKILPILCLFILLSFVFINNTSFATISVYNTLPEDCTIIDSSKMPELEDSSYRTFIWFHKQIGYICWFFTNCSDDFKLIFDTSACKWYLQGTADGVSYVYNYQSVLTEERKTLTFSSRWDEYHSGLLYLNNITVYNTDDSIFFQAPPVMGTLAPILGKVEMLEPTTREILILVPIMIILIASYLGLRKGLTFIKTLRKM